MNVFILYASPNDITLTAESDFHDINLAYVYLSIFYK